jgi:thiol-disulfide isomerase/thioredoxin
MFKNTITTFVMAALLSTFLAQATSFASSEAKENIHIKGTIRTKDGTPVKDIKVQCFYLNREIPWRIGNQFSDHQGKYDFEVPVGRTYWIEAGGRTSTYTESKRFTTQSQTDVSVEDLIVRPFSAKAKGHVVYEDGKPASNLTFGYNSKSTSPVDATNPPTINSDGDFTIDHLLPGELYSFWVFTEPDVYRVWKRLDPNVSTLQLTLRKKDCVELPTDWLYGGNTHEAIARDMAYAKNEVIDFELPDLNGKIVSLSDVRKSGKAVVVNISGASWCGGCRLEAPYLVEFYNRYKDKGLEVVSVVFEPKSNDKPISTLRSFKREHNINYTLLYGGHTDHEHVESVINGLACFSGYPLTIYIDRKGKVQFTHSGFYFSSEPHQKWQLDLMEKHIKAILSDDN